MVVCSVPVALPGVQLTINKRTVRLILPKPLQNNIHIIMRPEVHRGKHRVGYTTAQFPIPHPIGCKVDHSVACSERARYKVEKC